MFRANIEGASVDPGQVATGPRSGFLSGFDLALDQQYRAYGQMSIQAGFLEREQEVFEEMRSLGHQGFRTLGDLLQEEARQTDPGQVAIAAQVRDFAGLGSGEVSAALDALYGEQVPEYVNRALRRYDDQFSVLRDSPVGPTARDFSARSILGDAANRAVGAVQAAEGANTSFLGDIGFFLGGAAGYLSPSANPLGLVTAPLGGGGASVGARIFREGLVQAGVEAGVQITGGQETRRRLGLPSGFGEAVGEVAQAFAFGAAFQGAGEAVSAVFRRMFPRGERAADGGGLPGERRAAPTPLDAPDNPYGNSPLARQRANDDFLATVAQLSAWDGPRPFEARLARTDLMGGAAKLPDPTLPDFGRVYDNFVAGTSSIEDVARRVDPELVDKWERLTQRRERVRARVEELVNERPQKAIAAADEVDPEIARLQTRVADLEERIVNERKKSRRQELRRILREKKAQLTDLEAFQQQELAKLRGIQGGGAAAPGQPTRASAPEIALRGELSKIDEQLRDLAPLYGRVMQSARREWGSTGPSAEFLNTLKDLQQFGGVRRTLDDTALAALNKAEDELRKGGALYTPPVARSSQQIADAVKAVDEVAETQLAAVKRQAADETAETVNINGVEVRLSEKLTIPSLDGEGTRTVSVREALADIDIEDEVMGAFTTCRLS